MIIIIVYWVLGYISYGYVNSNKVYIYHEGQLFRRKLVMGLILGWLFIPIALLKMIFGGNN